MIIRGEDEYKLVKQAEQLTGINDLDQVPGIVEVKDIKVGEISPDDLTLPHYDAKITFTVYAQYYQDFIDYMMLHGWDLDGPQCHPQEMDIPVVTLKSRITYDQFKKYKDSLEEKKGNTNMKIIDETINKDEEPESYGAGDVIAYWNKPDNKHYLMLVSISLAGDGYRAVNLKDNIVGDDDIDCLNNFSYSSFTDIINELKAQFEHVEKVKTELHIVGRA